MTVSKKPGTLPGEEWFADVDIDLNHDLVAVIGNKGSGKSALADILALLGDTKNAEHFSFLTTERFRKAPVNRAQHFDGILMWASGTSQPHNLASNPTPESVERIRYIPQEFFEELCNEHVRGDSTRFEQELRAVIFSHIKPQDRLGKTSFNDLLDLKERELLGSLSSFRGDLSKLNARIESAESKLFPEVRKTLESKLTLKQQELAEHERQKPSPVPQPTGAPQDTVKLSRLTEIDAALRELNEKHSALEADQKRYTEQQAAVSRVEERLAQINRHVKNASAELTGDLKILGLKFSELVEVTTHEAILTKRGEELRGQLAAVSQELDSKNPAGVAAKIKTLSDEQKSLRDVLDAPTKLHQQYLADLTAWERKRSEIVGTADTPDTVESLKTQLAALDSVPDSLQALKVERNTLSATIYGALETQRNLREELFAPVQELINDSFELREDYRLQFQNALVEKGLEQSFFEVIKQNTGTFRGDDEGKITFRNIVNKHDANTKMGAQALIAEIMDATVRDLRTTGAPPVPIAKILRSGKSAKELYDALYGFTFLEPRYSLLFQDTHIAQLSPGQRGALLLIFYLLVDTDQSPIVLDQPEENLDNETVVGLLVPVVTKAKQKRQIIMVTHNPNLAVVCDAEQIIHAHFDRNNKSKITYTTGPIEDPAINKLVVDVLEGTKRAFNNRAGKYFP
jgi:ABC-type lipoprotein export system ATPase subunit